MKKQNLFALIPALCVSLVAGSTQARDIAKDFPIHEMNGSYCVHFDDGKQHCSQTKDQFTNEASESQYQDLMRMKRQNKSSDFNRSIIDAFVDNKITVLEYHYLKNLSDKLKAEHATAEKNSK